MKFYRITKDQLGWGISEKMKKQVLKNINDCLADPTSGKRDRMNAVRTLVAMNAQNIDLYDDKTQQDTTLNIIIKESEPEKKIEE